MPDHQPSKERLLARKAEIEAQLARVNSDLRIELDRDPEEQAIEIEQDEVSVSMEESLQTELTQIEDQLRDLDARGQ
jgi:hypothetical protein